MAVLFRRRLCQDIAFTVRRGFRRVLSLPRAGSWLADTLLPSGCVQVSIDSRARPSFFGGTPYQGGFVVDNATLDRLDAFYKPNWAPLMVEWHRLAIDLLIALAILLAIAFACEWSIHRAELRKR